MITIIGASGAVGAPTIRHLAKRGARVRALTSNEASANRLRAMGVAETVVGDFRNDADVARAVDGAAAVLHVPPRFTEDEAAIGLRVVAAAKRARVGRLAFSSAFHPQMRKMDHHWSKLLVEEAVIESGLPFTVLQPAMFMQNVAIEWREVVERGVYPRPYSPDRAMSVVDTEDLGEAAAKILTEPGYDGATFELASGDRPTHAEMAAHLSEALGRPVVAKERDLEEWKAWAKERGWKPWSIAAYAKMCEHYDQHGYPGGNALVLETILGRKPTDYRAFARRFVKEMAAA